MLDLATFGACAVCTCIDDGKVLGPFSWQDLVYTRLANNLEEEQESEYH